MRQENHKIESEEAASNEYKNESVTRLKQLKKRRLRKRNERELTMNNWCRTQHSANRW